MSDVQVTWKKIIYNARPVIKIMNLGNGSQFKLISFFYRSKLFVAIERIGSFLFDKEFFKSGEYVSEKLGTCIADGNILADWINVQLNMYDKQQGNYYLNYIREEKEFILYDIIQEIIKPIVIVHNSNIIEDKNNCKEYHEII